MITVRKYDDNIVRCHGNVEFYHTITTNDTTIHHNPVAWSCA